MPLSTPAGTFTVRVRRARTRPSPLHSPHGCSMTEPSPPQRGQARVVMTWPRNERCTCCTSPRPWQVSQVDGWVPYPFLDAGEEGWGSVVVVSVGITALFGALFALAG